MRKFAYQKKGIALALGSGSARGLAHIGIIRELETMGIVPDIVCGTSIGALMGAFYVSGQLDALENWFKKLSQWDMIQFMDMGLITRGGLVEGGRLVHFFQQYLGDTRIEDLPKPFACVATDLETGQEVWFTEGPVVKAVRASISLPVLFTPVKHGDQWLLDGGLVNPVPVSVCRALGAQRVIAVNLNGELLGKHFKKPETPEEIEKKPNTEMNLLERWTVEVKERTSEWMAKFPDFDGEEEESPGMFDVLAGFIDIMEDRITRSRMAGDPPDVVLVPRLGHLALLDFDNAEEAIAEGRACVQRSRPYWQDVLGI